MISAYLFINLSQEENDDQLLSSIEEIPEVIEAYRLYGTYDIIVLIEASDTKKLKDVTLNAVRKLRFVHSTMTLLSLSSFHKNK